jgi:hypothetical protein
MFCGSCKSSFERAGGVGLPRSNRGISEVEAVSMTIRIRTLLVTGLVAAAMWLAGCDHYNCSNGATFGNTSCTATGSGLGTGTGTGSATAFVYAVDEGGTIDGYELSASASTLTAISPYTAPTIPTGLPGYGMVVAQKQYLYTAFESTGQIYGWSIDSSGALTTISSSPFSAPYLIGNPSYGFLEVIANPAGTFLFVADASNESVHVYSIGSGGVLSEVSSSPFSIPFFPGNMGTDGLGKYLYVTGSAGVAAYSIGSSGALTAVTGSPFSYPMSQVQGDPSGDFLVGIESNVYGENELFVFSITQSGSTAGAITPVSGSPFTTVYSPYTLAVQPQSGGTGVYTFSYTSAGVNPVEGYTLSSTGTLTEDSGSPFGTVGNGTWGQFDQSGAYLFAYYSYTSGGDDYVTTIAPLDVGSGGVLTQPISTLSLPSPGFWAVADAP